MADDTILDAAGWDRVLKTDPDVKRGKVELAREVAGVVRQLSPRDRGSFVSSIQVVSDERSVRVESDDPEAHIIENGSEDTPEFAPFGRAAARYRSGTQTP